MFRSHGNCQFVLRMYSEKADADADRYIVELQRRRGCCNVFKSTYQKLVSNLAHSGHLVPDCPIAKRLQELERRCDGPKLPRSLEDDVDPSDDDVAQFKPTPVEDAHAIVESFASLNTMLTSEFDDIACPAAQSIASLTVSRRIRAALGAKAVAGLENAAHATSSASSLPMQSPSAATRQTSTSSVASSATAVDRTDGQTVLTLLRSLLVRAISVAYSVESRTGSAIAVANLSQDPQCAEAFAFFKAPAAMLTALASVPITAQTAALRRELITAVWRIVNTSPATVDGCIRDSCHKRAAALQLCPITGVDPVFDACLSRVITKLQTAAAAAGASGTPTTPGTPAAGGK